MLRITQIKISIHDDLEKIKSLISQRLKISASEIIDYRIFKESIDARRRGEIWFIYAVDVNVKNEARFLNGSYKNVALTPDAEYKDPEIGAGKLANRPVVVGFGPAGMFAALLLAQHGYKPIVLERGESVDERVKSIEIFWTKGELKPNSNVQFGEGGAGTFSDGKLTTRVKDLRGRKVLQELVRAGAPEEILYKAHPHVGTDLLRDIVKNIRKEIISRGGEIRFNTQVEKFVSSNGALSGLVLAGGEELPAERAILAIGHSARDTFAELHREGVDMSAKPFAVGVRIEHPQAVIDKAQYKEFAGHERLGAAEYHLTHKANNGRGVYTFCMCPGGMVVASTSEEGCLVTNGMSEQARNQPNANSGLLVQVTPEDFGSEHPLAGIEFQRKLEAKAFELGGSTYQAPAQLVGDFLKGQASTEMRSVKPSYSLGVKPTDLSELFPHYITSALKNGLIGMDRKLRGFAMPDAVMTGVESRSSSPVRINRDHDSLESLSIAGIYPSGEGAGFAGGIVSAAIDGLKCAESIITQFSPK
ncbi:MAG: NAD(P)/FAD-dependent oxidoreductase [Lactobacillales bacterium]|jgi:uncharacterized FAD-dependent dehydrogenase|nr:NAD(P)/FAD-dependent oxidoreductase [Lactobacillales bacterium]